MPELMEFPHCCTAKIMVDFGESVAAEGGSYELTPSEMETNIREALDSLTHTQGMVSVTTNDAQKTANKILLKLGFEHSSWIYKRAHANTRIRLWWLDMSKYHGDTEELKKKNKEARRIYTLYNWRN